MTEANEIKKAVAEILNYDDAVYFVYESSGKLRVSFYAAYWRRGKMSHRLVASHTPDVCWVGSGWKCLSRSTENVTVFGAESPLRMEHRIFAREGRTEHVAFFHIVGGATKSYGTGAEPPWSAIFSDFLDRGFRQREEQFFVRISSNQPFEEFKDTAPVKLFLGRLAAQTGRGG